MINGNFWMREAGSSGRTDSILGGSAESNIG
jgi:hypothetical protein